MYPKYPKYSPNIKGYREIKPRTSGEGREESKR